MERPDQVRVAQLITQLSGTSRQRVTVTLDTRMQREFPPQIPLGPSHYKEAVDFYFLNCSWLMQHLISNWLDGQ